MRRKNRVIALNLAIMLGIVLFVGQYVRGQGEQAMFDQMDDFQGVTVAMEQVTGNYLEGEQSICNVWAQYINSRDMTMDEAVEFVRESHVRPDTSAHIIYVDDKEGSMSGQATRTPSGKAPFVVSYAALGLEFDLSAAATHGEVHVTRAYTNPLSGVQSLAFYNAIHLVDEQDGSSRAALLLRVVPLSYLEGKWVFPVEEFETAQTSLIDKDGNYIIKGRDFKNASFIEFYKSYNRTDRAELEVLKKDLSRGTGTLVMRNSRGMECLVAHTPVASTDDWTILNYVPMDEVQSNNVDWFLLGVVATGLMVLLVFDFMYMQYFNRQLEAAAREAESANRAKSEFLSAMSHDIRTPMNAICGLTAILERSADDPQTVRDGLRKIDLASNHLLTLINDVLDISKVESGRLTLTPVTFSIAETAENLVNISQPMVKEKSIDFAFRTVDMNEEYLRADQLRLNQIFINILSNAIKYTEPFGRVEVDMREDPSPVEGAVRLVYKVADTGMGMSEEFMAQMYEPFSRQTDSRVNTIQGTGLGLAITKQMVDLMGGTIECQSRLGEGTTFVVTLDLEVGQRSVEDMVLEPMDVLVVDDDEILLETACATLESLGVRVQTRQTGTEGLQTVIDWHDSGNDFGVVIVDWKMADMDGIEVVRRIRSAVGDALPILLISAYDWADIEDEAKAAGANGFVSKPLFRSTLYEKISELLGREVDSTDLDDDTSDIEGMHVLVAEDNETNWEIIEALLEMSGITCDHAENGQICVDMLREAPEGIYDLVFMDIQMPVMNGLEATRAIRALDNWAGRIPIVALTADAFSENVAECLNAGMDGHIAKPIDMKLVFREIRRIKENRS